MVKINNRQVGTQEVLTCQLFLKDHQQHPKDHSREIDNILGFNIFKIEKKLSKTYQHFSCEKTEGNVLPYKENRQSWIGLDSQTLLTPYHEIAQLCELLKNDSIKTIVDLGCAYGRVGIVSSVFFPTAEFIGLELVKKRINEARRIYERHGIKKFQLIECDLINDDFVLPCASLYYIYDFGRVSDLKKILTQFINVMNNKSFILVARGDEVQSLMLNFFTEFKKEKMIVVNKYLIYKN